MSSVSLPARGRHEWLWLLGVWLIAVTTLVWRTISAGGEGSFFGDTDDAMRMVVVRDFLAGQGWYDLVQHRLNTPFGAEIHWSRLIDLPLAGILFLAGLFTDPHTALVVTGMVWPLLLSAVLLWLSVRVTTELVGPEGLLPALVLPILSPAILAEFSPGRVDHHNVIILLTLACLWASLVALRRPIAAWVAGLLAATALAIALEAAPLVVATILAFGFAYVATPSHGANLRRFGLAFGGGLAFHLALVRTPDRWLEAACDMNSPVYVLAGVAVAAAYLLVSLVPAPAKAWQRLGFLALVGTAAVALVALAYPQCLAGPYGALDPWLQENWIAAIVEAKPWHQSLIDLPAYSIVVAVPVFLGLVAAGLAAWREPEKRLAWLTTLVFLACAMLVMLAQVRGARLAILPTIPAAAWLIVRARQAYLARPKIVPALGLLGAWLAFSGVILAVIVGFAMTVIPSERAQTVAEVRANKLSCFASDSFVDLRGMPPERIMAPIDLGSHLLLETDHAVVAAPYHRNEAGVLDTFRFFNRPVEEARAIASQRGLGLVVTCPAMPEMQGPGVNEPNTVLSLLAADTLPDWLADVSLGGPLKVYAILP